MGRADHAGINAAFERIEESLLPGIALMLDTLLEAASLARPGIDGDSHAARLRAMALQIEELTRLTEAAVPPAQPLAAASAA